MQFGFNAMGFHADPAESVPVVAEAGYDGVEFSLDTEDALVDERTQAALADLAADHGLTTYSVLTPAFWEHPLTSTDAKTRAEGIQYGRALVDAAVTFDADTALIVPGIVDKETPYDVAYENALESVCELADYAASKGVTLAVENVWNDFLLSPREFAAFVDAAAEAGPVGAYFDVGNVCRFGYPEQWIRILGDRIAAVHVKDYDKEIDTIDGFTYPLQGSVDWEAVATALDDVGYDGWISPEVPPYETRGERMPEQVLANLDAVLT